MPSTRTQAALGASRPVKWDRESDRRLTEARREGMAWPAIAEAYFPGQSSNACRKRYERVVKEMKREEWGGPKLQDLAVEYEATREKMWSILADRLDEKWEIIEAKCMEKGVKQLTTIARSARRSSTRPSTLLPPPRRAGMDPYFHDDDSGIGMDDAENVDPSYLHAPTAASPGRRGSSHRRNVSGSSGSSGSHPRSTPQQMQQQQHHHHYQQQQHQRQQRQQQQPHPSAYAPIHASQQQQQQQQQQYGAGSAADHYNFAPHPTYYLSAQVAPPPPSTRAGGGHLPSPSMSGMAGYPYPPYMPATAGAASTSSYGNAVPPLNSMLQQQQQHSKPR